MVVVVVYRRVRRDGSERGDWSSEGQAKMTGVFPALTAGGLSFFLSFPHTSLYCAAHSSAAAAGAVARQAADDDVEDGDDAVQDGLEDRGDAVDDGHEGGADGLEDGLDAGHDCAHGDGVGVR